MAAGKTRAAQAAADRLGTQAIDADELLERELGAPIAEFFEREGEEEFRRREEELVLRLLDQAEGDEPAVLALGGRRDRERGRQGRPALARRRLVRRRRGDRLAPGGGFAAAARRRPRGLLAPLRRAPAAL